MASRTIIPTDPTNSGFTPEQLAARQSFMSGGDPLKYSTTINRFPDMPESPKAPQQRSLSTPSVAPQQSAQDIMKSDFTSGNQQQIQSQADALSQPTSLMGAVQDALNQRIKMSRGEWNDKTTQAYNAAQAGPDSQVNRITAGMNLDPSTVASIYSAQASGQSADLQQVLALEQQDKQQQQQNLDKFSGTITELGKQYLQKSQDMKSEQQQVIQNKVQALQLQMQIPEGQTYIDPTSGKKMNGLGANENIATTVLGNGDVIMYDKKTGDVKNHFDANGQVVAGSGYSEPTPVEHATMTDAPPGTQLVGNVPVKQEDFNQLFNVGGQGGQCGHYGNVNSTGARVGDSWYSKVSLIDKSEVPKAGDKMVLPLAVSTDGKKGYGHVQLVLGYNPDTGIVYGTQSNADGKSEKVTTWSAKLSDLKNKWDKDPRGWGFIPGNLSSSVQKSVNSLGEKTGHMAGSFLGATPEQSRKLTEMGGDLLSSTVGWALPRKQIDQPKPATAQEIVKNAEKTLQPYFYEEGDSIGAIANQFFRGTYKDTGSKSAKLQSQIISKVTAKDPTFDTATYSDNAKTVSTLRAVQGTQMQSAAIQDENVKKQIESYKKILKKVSDSGKIGNLRALSDAQLKGGEQISDPDLAEYVTLYNQVIDPYSKILSGAQTGSVSATSPEFMEQAKHNLDFSQGYEAQLRQLAAISSDAEKKIATIKDGSYIGAMLNPVSSQNPLAGIPPNYRKSFIENHPDLFGIQTEQPQNQGNQEQRTMSGNSGGMIEVQAPDGNTYHFSSQAQADQFRSSF